MQIENLVFGDGGKKQDLPVKEQMEKKGEIRWIK